MKLYYLFSIILVVLWTSFSINIQKVNKRNQTDETIGICKCIDNLLIKDESYNFCENKKKIAILYICTGKYEVLWKEFYESMEDKFITDLRKDYFVFTDSNNIFSKEKDNVHVIPQKNLGWPGNTLYRFHMFLSQKEKLMEYEYLIFMNANVKCKHEISSEEFLPKNEGLLFVQHPFFYNKSRRRFTYERNSKSTAYIPRGKGRNYIQGSVNGGKTSDYLHMCEILKSRIDEDDKNNIVAVWHDESHLNKYLLELDENQYKLLNISYNYAFYARNLKYKPKLFLRNKGKYFDIYKIKGEEFRKMIQKNRKRRRGKNKKIKRRNNIVI